MHYGLMSAYSKPQQFNHLLNAFTFTVLQLYVHDIHNIRCTIVLDNYYT